MASSERDQEEARAIEQAWRWFSQNRDLEVPFSTVVMKVRARCPDVDPERVWEFFKVRLRREWRRARRRA
jgi:hypothetical protein